MAGRINAQIDLTKIYEMIKANHSSIQEAANGRTYCSVTIWLNDEVKEFPSKVAGKAPVRQDTSIQLNSKQNASDSEKAVKVYIGNGLSTFAGGGGGSSANFEAFAGSKGAAGTANTNAANTGGEPVDDLPF